MTLETLAEWQRSIEKRLSDLEMQSRVRSPKQSETLELRIMLPEADIDGLTFNEQTVKGIFDLKEDGKYHSRDILFMSARNTVDDNSRDILSEYLQSEGVKKSFIVALAEAGYEDVSIDISLPTENEGVKKYNGVTFWCWLENKSDNSSASFARVYSLGYAGHGHAAGIGGCAPVIFVEWRNE
jgi:hypothetical protein